MKRLLFLTLVLLLSISTVSAKRKVRCNSKSFSGLQNLSGKSFTIFYYSGSLRVNTDGAHPTKINKVFYTKKGKLIGESTFEMPELDFELTDRFLPNYAYFVVHGQDDFCLTRGNGTEVENFANPSDRVACDQKNKKYITSITPKKLRCKRVRAE